MIDYIKQGIETERSRIAVLPEKELASRAYDLNNDIDLNLAVQHEQLDLLAKLLELAGKSGFMDEMDDKFIEGVAMLIGSHMELADTYHDCLDYQFKRTVGQ